jgi:hypothetical protein
VTYLIDHIAESVDAYRPLWQAGLVLYEFVNLHSLDLTDAVPTILSFLVTFYMETTASAALENHDFSFFFKALAILCDAPSPQIAEFLSGFSDKILKSSLNQNDFVRLALLFAPTALSKGSDLAVETVISEQTTESAIRLLLDSRFSPSRTIRNLKPAILFQFPAATIFADLIDAAAQTRSAAEAFVFKLFPTVSCSENYQTAEVLIATKSHPNFGRMIANARGAPQDDGLRLLHSATEFLRSNFESLRGRTASLLRICQWLKLWTGDDSLDCFGELLLQPTTNPDPEFIELLRLIGQSVNRLFSSDFFAANEAAILETLKPDQHDSFCRLLFIFDAFADERIQRTILESDQLRILVRSVLQNFPEDLNLALVIRVMELVSPVRELFLRCCYSNADLLIGYQNIFRCLQSYRYELPPQHAQRLVEAFFKGTSNKTS